jgi:TonB-dependent receptor
LFDNFSPTQGGGIFCAYCGYATDFDDSILRELNLDGFLGGVDGRDGIPLNFLTASFEDAFAQLNSDAAISDPNRSGRGALSDAELRARRDASGSFLGFYEPEFNPAGSFSVDETVTSAFFNASWVDKSFGSVPFSANLGFRIDHTETSSSGVDQPVTQFRESDGDTQLIAMFANPTEVIVENDYTNFLPSANIKLDVAEDKVVRLAASKTVTRPTLTALGVANAFGGRANAPTSSGGNPNLEAFESTNLDVSFEWYLDDLSFFGVTGFYKSFDNFLESQTLPVPGEVVFPAGNASNPTANDVTRAVTFLDTRTRNGETGSIVGVEAALQKAFDNGFGAAVNYTFVDSSIDRANGSGNEDLDYNGLSPHSFNVSGFYEKGPIQARVTYNYRDEFLVQAFSDQGEPRQREAYGQLDLSASYDVNDMFQVFAEGVNVLDEDTRDFSRFQNRFLTYEDTGSRFTLGARATF